MADLCCFHGRMVDRTVTNWRYKILDNKHMTSHKLMWQTKAQEKHLEKWLRKFVIFFWKNHTGLTSRHYDDGLNGDLIRKEDLNDLTTVSTAISNDIPNDFPILPMCIAGTLWLCQNGKSPCSMEKNIISMVSFQSYFDITRGYIP